MSAAKAAVFVTVLARFQRVQSSSKLVRAIPRPSAGSLGAAWSWSLRGTLTLIVMPKCDQVEDECGEDPGPCSTSGAGEVERCCRGGEQQRSTEDECDSR